MNKGLMLALLCAALVVADGQEPPGCSIRSQTVSYTHSGEHAKHAAARRHKTKPRKPRRKTAALEGAIDRLSAPVIASPIYVPQPGERSAAAITESRGFLYVVVGNKLYKVDETTLRTVKTSELGLREETSPRDKPASHKGKKAKHSRTATRRAR
ncbi:MAG TPA: hypothetical protein VMI31_06280 [Fimbriimonadaceae bacterium]|nr:hypothetical protein [Fimbriimonadaceae bacterium]